MYLSDLNEVNRRVNRSTTYKSDVAQYGVEDTWGYPRKGFGDCEDYALLKRQLLIEAGADPSVLNIAICRDQSGAGHAVLIASLDQDWVLDNQTDEVLPWSSVPYQWIEVSVNGSFAEWNDIRQG